MNFFTGMDCTRHVSISAPVAVFTLILSLVTGCSSPDDGRFTTEVHGQFIILNQDDSTQDFSGFEILIANQEEGDVDTLGFATTSLDGQFRMSVRARSAGVYPIVVRREDVALASSQIVIAEGDTTAITGRFPLENRRLRIVSAENAAWTAYLNIKAQYSASMVEMLQAGDSARQSVPQISEQTASLFWSLRETYPDTYGSDIASVESIQMLEGFNDPLAVDRLQELGLDNIHIVDAVRAARRSEARIAGQDASIALIRYYLQNLDNPEQKASLQSELVIAHSDSLESDKALEVALALRRDYPDSEWSEWASRAAYDLENLMPGMPAPAFSIVTRDGDTFTLDNARNRYFILEFYQPRNRTFLQELRERNVVFEAMNPLTFRTLSVSVEPDRDINEAFFDDRVHAGTFAYAADSESGIIRTYNINVIPTRYLIDPDGTILAKYSGHGLRPLEMDLIAIIRGLQEEEGD